MKLKLISIFGLLFLSFTASALSSDPLMDMSVENTQANAKLGYLLKTYQSDPSVENRAAVEHELASMKRLDAIFTGITQELHLDLTATSSKIDFDCYKKRMEMYAEKCGRLTDYGLKYAKTILMTCGNGVSDDSFETVLNKYC